MIINTSKVFEFQSALTQSKIKLGVSSLQNLIETSWFPSNFVSLKVGSEEESKVELKFGDEVSIIVILDLNLYNLYF